ncbi:protein kinase domain-containing protein [Lysobacter sp. A421]
MPATRAHALKLFDEYVEMSRRRQLRALERLRDHDRPLHDALADMLAADALEHPLDGAPFELLARLQRKGAAVEPPPPDLRLGTRLGAWQIDRIIGTGGMGTVYEAHRADDHYQQRVALKCIRAGLCSPRLIQAFLDERNNLAQLDHPGIAALLDGGVEPDGQPWFTMHYVDGIPIDHWCAERQLPVHERVKLLMQVCDALACAHGKLVLHQDINTSNVLVTGDGRVQLLDFGLSSTLTRGKQDHPSPMAVPNGYTAPEILSGIGPHVGTDIYSLGVVMYRLLCGGWPLPPSLLRTRATPLPLPAPMDEVAVVATYEMAWRRGFGNPQALRRHLAGDLSAIGLKCVANTPGQRYRNATELQDDLLRWLKQLPVQAHSSGTGYRLGKFLRRNRLPVVLTAAVALAVAGGLGVNTIQHHRMAREAGATRAVSHLFEQMLGNATLSGLSETPFSSRTLLKNTEAQLRQEPLQSHPTLLSRGLSALARGYAVIGDYPKAAQLAREAEAAVPQKGVENAEARATWASLLNLQALHAQAGEVASAGLQRLGSLDDKHAGHVRLRLLTEQARAQWGMADSDLALVTLQAALTSAEAMSDTDPEPLAELLTLRGSWRTRILRFDDAERDLRRAIALVEDDNLLLADEARQQLAQTLVVAERTDEAAAIAQALVESRRRSLGEQHPDTGIAWVVLADNQFMQGQIDASAESLARGKAILQQTYGVSHPEYAEALRVESLIDYARDNYETSLEKSRDALAIIEKALGPEHDMARRARHNLGNKLSSAPASWPAERYQAAINESIALNAQLLQVGRTKHIPMPQQKLHLARTLMSRHHTGDLADAEHLLRGAMVDAETYYGSHHTYPMLVRHSLAILLFRTGHTRESYRQLGATIDEATALLPATLAQAVIYESLRYQALCAVREGDTARAEALLLEASDVAAELLGTDHMAFLETRSSLEELRRTGTLRDAEDALVAMDR